MDPNDIWRVSDLKWNYLDDVYRQALGYVEYFEQTTDGLKIHFKKGEKDEIRLEERNQHLY